MTVALSGARRASSSRTSRNVLVKALLGNPEVEVRVVSSTRSHFVILKKTENHSLFVGWDLSVYGIVP